MTDENKQADFEGWEPKIHWFHVFRSLFESGDAREMGGSCFLVYACIKARINYNTGRTFPSIETIAHDCGFNRKTVMKYLNKLEDMGYLQRIGTRQRSNTYKIIEKIKFEGKDSEGEMVQMDAEFDYLPKGVSAAVRDIRNVMIKGALPEGSTVRIDNLTVNIQVLPKATRAQQITVEAPRDKKIQALMELWERRGDGRDDGEQE